MLAAMEMRQGAEVEGFHNTGVGRPDVLTLSYLDTDILISTLSHHPKKVFMFSLLRVSLYLQ